MINDKLFLYILMLISDRSAKDFNINLLGAGSSWSKASLFIGIIKCWNLESLKMRSPIQPVLSGSSSRFCSIALVSRNPFFMWYLWSRCKRSCSSFKLRISILFRWRALSVLLEWKFAWIPIYFLDINSSLLSVFLGEKFTVFNFLLMVFDFFVGVRRRKF